MFAFSIILGQDENDVVDTKDIMNQPVNLAPAHSSS